jgi:hypothetical protein
MGEEVGTMQFLEFKGEQIKKFKGEQIKKFKGEQIKNQNSDVKVTLPNV